MSLKLDSGQLCNWFNDPKLTNYTSNLHLIPVDKSDYIQQIHPELRCNTNNKTSELKGQSILDHFKLYSEK